MGCPGSCLVAGMVLLPCFVPGDHIGPVFVPGSRVESGATHGKFQLARHNQGGYQGISPCLSAAWVVEIFLSTWFQGIGAISSGTTMFPLSHHQTVFLFLGNPQ